MANVVARSAFVNQVEQEICTGCELCLDYCQFDALSMREDAIVQVNTVRCVGCGVCVLACPDEALSLVRRSEEEILPIPDTEFDWRMQRATARGQDLATIDR